MTIIDFGTVETCYDTYRARIFYHNGERYYSLTDYINFINSNIFVDECGYNLLSYNVIDTFFTEKKNEILDFKYKLDYHTFQDTKERVLIVNKALLNLFAMYVNE